MKVKRRWIFGFVCLLISISQKDLFGAEPPKPQTQSKAAAAGIPSLSKSDRDPFAPVIETGGAFVEEPSGTGKGEEEIVVKLEGIGIGSGEQDAFALMNKDVFYEGEEKKGIKLLRVRKEDVLILANGNPRTLSLVPEAEITRLNQRKERKNRIRQSPI